MDFSLITALENEFVDERGYVKRKINCAKCLTLLNELRSSLPMCIEEAQRIVDNKQRILANADSVAKATVETAQKKSRKNFVRKRNFRASRRRGSKDRRQGRNAKRHSDRQNKNSFGWGF